MNYEITIAPGAVGTVNGAGDFFAVVSAAQDILIRIPGNEFTLFSQGDSLVMPAGEIFKRLEIRNPSATASMIVVIYAGFGRYSQQRVAMMEPRTEFVSWAGTQLDPATGQTFAGTPIDRRVRRKCVQVTNGDATLRLQVRDAAGNVGLEIFPETSVTLPISETVEIYNPNGAAVACRVSEIWWTA